MEQQFIRCSCKMPHFCILREPNRTHGVTEYPPEKPNPERIKLWEEHSSLGTPGQGQTMEQSARQKELFQQLTAPFNEYF